MGKFEHYTFFAHFGDFPIILNQNLIFQTILLVIMALCLGINQFVLVHKYPSAIILGKTISCIFPESPFQRWKVIDDCMIILQPTLNRRLD